MGFLWVFFFMLSWMFQHDYLDTYCFECLICMCFVFLYLHLFSAIEHVSHGKALEKYAHCYYYFVLLFVSSLCICLLVYSFSVSVLYLCFLFFV